MKTIKYTVHEGFLKRHAANVDEVLKILKIIPAGSTYYITDKNGKDVNPIMFEVLDIHDRIERLQIEEDLLREQLKKLQKICPHEETELTYDPSGNNGDGYTCLICGVDI